MDLNIYAFVGMIMLIGIVEKNAIMQIDFALEAERGGKTPEAAIYEGCLIRFRPIMMTTMAALLGAVPIAVGYGAGGEARQTAGARRGRWITLFPARDVVPDAGRLHIYGSVAGVDEVAPCRPRPAPASGQVTRRGWGLGASYRSHPIPLAHGP
jgi:hypothetical protein